MTLDEFLLARISDDEEAARAAGAARWQVSPPDRDGDQYLWDYMRVRDSTDPATVGLADAEHVARHDPARVLAECAAKRAIVGSRESCEAMCVGETDLTVQLTGGGMTEGLRIAMKYLALPYADHPEYDEAWRP